MVSGNNQRLCSARRRGWFGAEDDDGHSKAKPELSKPDEQLSPDQTISVIQCSLWTRGKFSDFYYISEKTQYLNLIFNCPIYSNTIFDIFKYRSQKM